MKTTLCGVTLVAALASCSLASAAGPSGGAYAIPSSTVASGISGMAGGSYTVSSSLGDLSHLPLLSSPGYEFYPGFWSAFSGAVAVGTCLLDIDGNGAIDALTDGLLIMRAMSGLTGTAVTAGAIGPNAQWTTWAEIQPRIHFSALDIDGNSATDALTDGLLLLRAMFGLTGIVVTDGAVAAGAQRATWAAIRDYLNTSCGANFAP